MGREIRRVPANWDHPARTRKDDPYGHGGYQPMYDQHFDERFAEWLADFDRIRSGDLTDIERECYALGLADWLSDEGLPPNPSYYRTFSDDDATWFQMYETVSEGTPVSPPFATREELVSYLAANGDFWDQERGTKPLSREAYEKFVNAGWAPSMVMDGGKMMSGVEFVGTSSNS